LVLQIFYLYFMKVFYCTQQIYLVIYSYSYECGLPDKPYRVLTYIYYFIKNGWLCNILGNNVDNACQDDYEEI
jgi:hypothetical protein